MVLSGDVLGHRIYFYITFLGHTRLSDFINRMVVIGQFEFTVKNRVANELILNEEGF